MEELAIGVFIIEQIKPDALFGHSVILRGWYMFKRGHVVTLWVFANEFVGGLDGYLYKEH
jgi:hypothetical protein